MRDRKLIADLFFILLLLIFFGCSKATAHVALSSDGLNISYDVQGKDAPALVFIHGWSCDRTYWDAQVPYFSKKCKTVVIDLAGHGESGLDRKIWSMEAFGKDVVAVIKQLGIKKVVLIGHSMGGAVILEAAQIIPERVIGLVGVGTFERIRGPVPQEWLEKFLVPFQTNFSDATDSLVRRDMFTANSDPALIEKIANDMASEPPEVGLSALTALFQYDYISAIQQIDAPIRCINPNRNENDVKEAQRYAKSYDVIEMPNVGHFVMMEDPKTFNQLLDGVIRDFINIQEE